MDPSLREFCLYMAFWPTVVSGPVSRLPMMLPQLRRLPGAVAEDVPIGLVRLVQGLFMKFVLAHLLSVGLVADGGVTAGFDGVAPRRSGLDVWALAIGFGLQIFFDFAGYSNMAIGAARMMGIRLPENFNRPYLSVTPSIFWTRWHMSLSFWIRDYVFMPLATLRREPWWLYAALLISMVIFGLWHEAKLTFILWGLYHGVLLVGHRLGQQVRKRLRLSASYPGGPLLSWLATALLISLSWILFRANDAGQALQMLAAVVTPRFYSLSATTLPREYYQLVALMSVGYFLYVGAAQLVLSWGLYIDKLRSARRRAGEAESGLPAPAPALLFVDGVLVETRWWWFTPALALLLMVTSLTLFGQSSNIAPFIYTLF
jgi:alginate O-acetyltransferase complex protein AlgI